MKNVRDMDLFLLHFKDLNLFIHVIDDMRPSFEKMYLGNILIFLGIIIKNYQINANLLHSNIIESYLEEKSLKYAQILTCTPKPHQLELMKSQNRQMTSILNIKNASNLLSNVRNNKQIGVILDGDCQNSQDLLINSGFEKLFDVRHHWLIISNNKTKIIEKITKVNMNINADINLVTPSSSNPIENAGDVNYTITDLYNPAYERGGTLKTSNFGYYYGGKYRVKKAQAKYWTRKNMTGVVFKTMVVLPVPFEGNLEDYLKSDADRDVNTFNRFHARLVNFCRDYYNFSMDMRMTDSWGYTFPNGSFDGMVGELEREKIDFGASPLFVRTDRAQVIEYGRNTWILRAEFIFRNPKAATSIEIFFKPLSTSIWLITAALSVVAVVILKSVTAFERNRFDSRSHGNHVEDSWSFSALFTLGAFCQQGSPTTPYLTCGRIITMTIFLLSVIIYQFYSASIVSSLLMKPATLIRTIEELLKSPLKVGCEDILYTKDYLQHTTDQTARELYAKKILGKNNQSNFLAPEIGLELVEQGNYAFHVEVATAYPIIQSTFSDKVICELKEVQLFRTQPMHANYQKNSPFRDMLDTCLQRLSEFGILYRERRHWHPKKPECVQSSRSVTFNVGIEDFYPALLILLMGIGISLVILIIERRLTSGGLFLNNLQIKPKRPNEKVRVYPFIH